MLEGARAAAAAALMGQTIIEESPGSTERSAG